MTLLILIFKIICCIAIIPIIGYTVTIIALLIVGDKPINKKPEKYKYYWWFDKGIWRVKNEKYDEEYKEYSKSIRRKR